MMEALPLHLQQEKKYAYITVRVYFSLQNACARVRSSENNVSFESINIATHPKQLVILWDNVYFPPTEGRGCLSV